MSRWLWVYGLGMWLLGVSLGCERGGQAAGGRGAGASGAAGGERIFRFISMSEHHHLDPQRLSWVHDGRVAMCLWEPLVRTTVPELALEPGAAEKWDVSADGLTYTFHLRDCKWSDGSAVSAEDYIFAWRRALMPDTVADYKQHFYCIKGAAEFVSWRDQQLKAYKGQSVRTEAAARKLHAESDAHFKESVGLAAPDERTLVVTLARPTPYFLELCAFASFLPVQQKSVEKFESVTAETGVLMQDSHWLDPENLVTNGPYVLKGRKFRQSLTLRANPHYWDRAAMGNDGIDELIIADMAQAILNYKRGRADWLPDVPTAKTESADLLAQNDATLHLTDAAGTYFYNFNCMPALRDGTKNPLADVRVRQALSLGMDRQTIVSKVTRLNQKPARTFVPPGTVRGYEPPAEAGPMYDVAKARKLLAEAGYPGGKGLEGLSILYNTGQGHENIAQAIKYAWEKELGVVVKLEGQESLVFGERLKTQDFTISRASWFGDYRDPTTFLDKFRTGYGNNDTAWSNAEFDKLMAQADGMTEVEARMQTMQQAEALMLREHPIAPIYQYNDLSFFDAKKVDGVSLNIWKVQRLERVKVGGS